MPDPNLNQRPVKSQGTYDRTIGPAGKDSLSCIARLVRPGSCVLDLGAAAGPLGKYLVAQKQCIVDGVEIDPDQAREATGAYRKMLMADLETIRLIEHLPLRSYDYIVCADILEHLRDPDRLLDQLHALLREGGRLLLSVPNIAHAGVIASLIAGEFTYRPSGILDITHLRFFTRSSLFDFLGRRGFAVTCIETVSKDLRETEFRDRYLDALSENLFRTILAQPDALTYQFIVEAAFGKHHTTSVAQAGVQRPRFGCQLFWHLEGEDFSADRSCFTAGIIGEERQVIAFNLPSMSVAPVALRLDPADRPGFLHIHAIRLLDSRNAIIWQWDGDLKSLAVSPHQQIAFLKRNQTLLILGDDPQLILPVPTDRLGRLTDGGTVEMEAGWPMSSDFLEAVRLVSDWEHTQLALQSKLDQARTETQRLHGELDQALMSIAQLEETRRAMLASSSWRLTAPLRAVGWFLRLARRVFGEAARQLYSREPQFQEITPPENAVGFLEIPQANGVVEKTLTVSGWLFLKNTAVRSVLLAIDSQPEMLITYGYSRPDVAQTYPGFPHARTAGFRGGCSINGMKRNRAVLTVWAKLEDGTRIKCFTRRVAIRALPPPIKNPPFVLAFLLSSVKKGWRAFRNGRLPFSPSLWLRALHRNYELVLAHRQAFAPQLVPAYAVGASIEVLEPYQQWIETNRLTLKLLSRMRGDARRLAHGGPKISVVVPVFNTPAQFLREMIESVIAQIYPNWELCLADDASTEPHVRELLKQAQIRDARVKVVFRPTNGHIVEATNSALGIASGDYIAFLDHDDVLSQDALLHVAECLAQDPDVDWVYTDEDKIDHNGRRYDPQFKGAWSPEMAITHTFTHHLSVIRKSLIDSVGQMRAGFEGAQDLDLFLRVAELTSPDCIRHVPQVCYHWRSHGESTASHGTQKGYVFTSARRAIVEALARRGLKAEPVLPTIAELHGLCLYQLKWQKEALIANAVTIVIPTRDRIDLLKRCVISLQKTVDPKIAMLLIVDDRSSEPQTQDYFEKLRRDGVLGCRVVAVTSGDGSFNYARLVNSALPYLDTPYVIHLNNDIEALEPGWLEDMLGWMSIPGVGAVGARLLYPDRKIQHTGVIVGPHGGLADHQFHLLPTEEVGFLALPHAARNVSAVTGACLLTRIDLYKELGGFDDANFGVEYNDVDFCLRLIKKGMRVVYTPQATLVHLTSVSRGRDFNPDEHINFLRKYRGFRDPYFNENISIDSMWMTVDPARFNHAPRISGLNIVLISHDLNLAGAPIVAYEFARHYVAHGCRVTLVTPQDGPLRDWYEALDIHVCILDGFPVLHQAAAGEMRSYLRRVGEDLNLGSFNLVVCNTLTVFWGVELARLFAVPSIWHIHESTSVTAYSAHLEESTRNLLRSAFISANRVVFQAEATRRLFHDVNARDNFLTIPGGVPIARIEAFRAAHTKASLRAKYGIDEDAIVVTLPGTTCERKGQHVFLEAIKELSDRHSDNLARKITFLLVGAIPGPYLDSLRARIRELKQQDIRLIDETKDIYDFYGLSDIFVCASFVESFPMVVLLAMAFQLPIISTDVFGIPEIINDGHEAHLVKPGDAGGLAEAMHMLFRDPFGGYAMAARAHAKAWRLFDSDKLLERHLLLAKQIAVEDSPGASLSSDGMRASG